MERHGRGGESRELPRGGGRHGASWPGHAGPGAAHPDSGGDAGRPFDGDHRRGEAPPARARLAAHDRQRSRSRRLAFGVLRLRGRQRALPRRGDRLRDEAKHHPAPERRRLPRDGFSGDRAGRDDPRSRSRRSLSFQRTRRSGRTRSADPHDRGPHREKTDLRDLPGAPASRARARREDLQAEVRTSRREPPGGGSALDGGRDHFAEPRFRSGRVHAAGGRRAHAPELERRHTRGFSPPHAPDPGGPVPPGGFARPARRQRPVRHLHRSDGAGPRTGRREAALGRRGVTMQFASRLPPPASRLRVL